MTGRTPEEYVDQISEFERMEEEFRRETPSIREYCPACEEVTAFNKSFADGLGVCKECGRDGSELEAIQRRKK